MTFQQLQYLLEVHRSGSISRAAENLFISRSSVSSSISAMEAELGYPIFVRTQQGLTLSPQGKLAVKYAEQICMTHMMMTELNNPPKTRRITIGISDYAPVVNAAVALVRDNKDREDLCFSFPVAPFNEIIDKISSNEMDAAVFCRMGNTQLSIESQLDLRGLEWKIIGTAPTVVIIGKKHPLSVKESLSLRDLENETFIDILSADISKNSFLRSAMKINRDKLLTTNSSVIRYELIREGLGYTIGRIPIAHIIKNYDLHCIPIPELYQPLIVVTNPNRPILPEVSTFLSNLEASLTEA